MRVSRSLTIKQMAVVSAIAVVTISIFIVLQLFHFVQQRRIDYAQQMENIAHTVRVPLSQAVLKGDISDAERILYTLKPAGVVARADIVVPGAAKALHVDFDNSKAVPGFITRLFDLPVQISLPLYSVERAGLPRPLAWLVLQADSWRAYQFILSILATMVITYLLLALILSVAISWCINRLIVHPIRNISRELQQLAPQAILQHKLALPKGHHDDEIGQLIHSYNHNQQILESMHDEMSRMTTHYAVTGLPDRRSFLALLEQPLFRTRTLALIVIRVETLQEASGVFSVAQYEILLKELVSRLRRAIDTRTLLAQTSPCEFALLMQEAPSPFRALRLARSLVTLISQPVDLQQLRLRPHLSIGMAISSDSHPAQSATEFLDSAISAMMSARYKGKNQMLFFEPGLAERAQKRLCQEHDILQGLNEGLFTLFIQPQVDMVSHQLVGAEALLRMRQDDGSYTLPESLIADAEELGVIKEIGRWALREACQTLADWQKQGIVLPLSVNLSALQLQDSTLTGYIKQLLARHQIAPGSLVLEITETARIGDAEQALHLLRALRAAGVTLALDDFGMGYSNLNYLHQFKSLPVSRLKMDRSFVAALPEDDTLVRIMAAIADIIGLEVIAEGVENAAQRDWLLARGIRWGQGYFYAGPLPVTEFMQQWLPPFVGSAPFTEG